MDMNEMCVLVGELRQLRSEAGLTLRELSLKTHVSDSSLSRCFSGQALPPWEVVAVLADLAGGDHAQLRRRWDAARRARLQSRWPVGSPETPATGARTALLNDRRFRPVVGVCALMAASGAVGWALGRR